MGHYLTTQGIVEIMYCIKIEENNTKHVTTIYTSAESEAQARVFCEKIISKMDAKIIKVDRA